MEYATTEKRTTPKDLKRKRLYNKYKKGGSKRTIIENGKKRFDL